MVEVNVRHFGILDQIGNMRGVKCFSMMGNHPSNFVVIWVDFSDLPERSGEPNKEDIVFGIQNGGAR